MVKNAVSSLGCLFLESAKANVGEDDFRRSLDGVVTPLTMTILWEEYLSRLEVLKAKLLHLGDNQPCFKSLDWRLEYSVSLLSFPGSE